jgi:FlaA1/EpsC-like NDP-sugar epimerase
VTRDLLKRLPDLARGKKRAILVSYDLAAMAFALWAAFSTRLGVFFYPQNALVFVAAASSFLITLYALYRLRIYHIVLRYFDMRAVTRLLSAAGIAAAVWAIIAFVTRQEMIIDGRLTMMPRSVAFIYCVFLFLLLFMGRYVMSLILAGADREDAPSTGGKNIIIYGANIAGISLADSVRVSSKYRLVAFVDPDPALKGQIVAGVPICSPEVLPEIAESNDVSEIFLAMPKATRSARLAAIAQVRGLNLEVKTVPAPEEIVSGRFTVSDIRPIDVSDLLRRDPVEPLGELISDAVEGHCILVTGAGGSIGSEICRQVVHAGPAKLVLLDHSEFALYTIHDQLLETVEAMPRRKRPQLVPVVGSMLNDRLVRQLIADNGVDTLYHAAAYKHVPLLEDNELVGVENNVFGTHVVAQAAFDAKLTRFTMISTDKAVRPKSIMGASKRVAELVIQGLAQRPECKTRFGIVRFGNVLDSSGSVVQRFRRQIRSGGPLTVTHKEITRFFMSIPEATQLVLQASAMAKEGEVFVLDMGEPVKITELARHMVNLSGMSVRDEDNPDGDIEIEFVGLRPGEKLYEELFVCEESLETIHPRIQMAKEQVLPQRELERLLKKLRTALDSGDRTRVRACVNECIAAEADGLILSTVPDEVRASAREG